MCQGTLGDRSLKKAYIFCVGSSKLYMVNVNIFTFIDLICYVTAVNVKS